MPRILKKVKPWACAVGALSMILFYLHWWALATLLVVVSWGADKVNARVSRAICSGRNRLSARRQVKEISTLVVGACVSRKVLVRTFGKDALLIVAPNRSADTSSLLLQHVSSCLRSGGRVCIILPAGKGEKKLTIFDLPFLSQLAKLEMNVSFDKRETRYPLFFHLAESMKFVRDNLLKRKLRKVEYTHSDIQELCGRKGFVLDFYKS